jgi:hypothetical protein
VALSAAFAVGILLVAARLTGLISPQRPEALDASNRKAEIEAPDSQFPHGSLSSLQILLVRRRNAAKVPEKVVVERITLVTLEDMVPKAAIAVTRVMMTM